MTSSPGPQAEAGLQAAGTDGPRVIAVCSQKGGVGKTATAVNLAAFLTHAGRRVLLVDLDPQGNATSALSVDPPSSSPLGVLIQDPSQWRSVTVETAEKLLSIVPGPSRGPVRKIPSIDPERIDRLRRELVGLKPAHDYVIIDTPPSLGPLSEAALRLSDSVLIPVQCEYFALQGLGQMLPILGEIRRSLGRRLDIEGILLTMFDEELDLSHRVAAELEKHFPRETFRTIIPRDVAIAECASHGQPVCEYDLRSRGAWAYLQLAKEIIENVR